MSLQEVLQGLADPDRRPTNKQLTELSDLDEDGAAEVIDALQYLSAGRRHSFLLQLADLAQDNIDVNYDAIFKAHLPDQDPTIRAAALQGLAEYEGRDLIPALADLLRKDEYAEVRREAAISLGRFALAVELGYLRESEGADIREVLIESATDIDEDDLVRARAVEALGALSGDETENLIESVYHEESPWLKIGAVDAMGRSCNEIWLPTVLSEMSSPSPEMRHAAAFAAGQIGEDEAIEPLKRLAIIDQVRDVQLAAIHALSEIGSPLARVALKSILFEGDDDLHEVIQETLTELSLRDD